MRPLVTTERLQSWWQQLNDGYFDRRLPPITIDWSPRLTASAGMFASRCGPRSLRALLATPPSHRIIRLSIPLLADRPESELLKTLAHEMIHQWQFDIRKRRPNHGEDFRRMMAVMNQNGLGIRIHHAFDKSVVALARYSWHCVMCGRVYRRHRRTIRPGRHRCGACSGRLAEILSATDP